MGRRWEVVFYETAKGRAVVREWLDQLGRKARAKVDMVLGLVASEGPDLRRPYSAPVEGAIRELRAKAAGRHHRLLYYFRESSHAVIVLGFIKKSRAIPPKEIETAIERMKDLERRIKRGEVKL